MAKRKKKSNKSSRKGGSFERQVCRDLSSWLSRGQRDDIFWRSAMSGGRATIGLAGGKQRSAQAGDISLIDDAGTSFLSKFVVECKRYADFNFASLMLKGEGKFLRFWRKHREECEQHGRLPFLIAKQDHMPSVLVMNVDGMLFFGLSLGSVRKPTHRAVIILSDLGDELYFLDWETFLATVMPPGIKVAAPRSRPRLPASYSAN